MIRLGLQAVPLQTGRVQASPQCFRNVHLALVRLLPAPICPIKHRLRRRTIPILTTVHPSGKAHLVGCVAGSQRRLNFNEMRGEIHGKTDKTRSHLKRRQRCTKQRRRADKEEDENKRADREEDEKEGDEKEVRR